MLLAAIDEQLDTVHEARVVRGEEQRGTRDLAGLAEASHRDLGRQVIGETLALCGVVTGEVEQAGRTGRPGLMVFTRTRRSFRSRIQLRAKARTAAFDAEYTLKAAVPALPAVEPVRITDAPSASSGSAFAP